MKAAILFDSSAYLTTPLNKRENLFQVDFTLALPNEEIITESTDENHLKEFFNQWIQEGVPQPKTAQPSVKDYHTAFQKILDAGYDTVFGVYLSSSVSGTFQTAESVSEEYRDKLKIVNFDAVGLSVNTEQLINQLVSMIDASWTVDKIVDTTRWLIDQSKFFIAVENNENLIQGGRGDALSSLEKSSFKTLPVLEYVTDRTPVLKEIFRTVKRRNNYLTQIAATYQEKFKDNKILVGIGHTLSKNKAEELKDAISVILPQQQIELRIIGTAFCSHLGRGALSFGLMPVARGVELDD